MKKNARTVSISASVAMIFVTVFAILSLTFAWYVKERTGSISSITMSAAGTGGIQLSGDAVSWKSILSTQDGDVNINQDLDIDSISSAGQVVDGQMQFYIGRYGDYGFQTDVVTEETILYYVFDFYVLNNDNVAKFLTLGYNSLVEDTNDKDIAYCTRVGFVNLGSSTTSSEALALDGTGVNNVSYIWEPNATIRNKRVELYHNTYIVEGKSPYNGIAMEATGLTLSNSLVVDSIGTPESEVLEVTTYDPISSGEKNEITLLMPSAITKVRVFIWAEGQDIDCTNSISGGTANVYFNFNSFDAEQVGETYVPIEYFNAPVITNPSGVVVTWDASNTNLSEVTFSSNYLVCISTTVGETVIPVRSICTTATSLDVDSLLPFESGTYFVCVRVIANGFGNSSFSNQLSFQVLDIPTDLTILSNVTSWLSVTNATSYTVEAFDEDTQTSYTATTTLTSLDLSTTLFSGGVYLTSGHTYTISVRANGTLGYAISNYSTGLSWVY